MNKLVFAKTEDRHLGRAIRMQAEQNGDTVFLMFGERRYTYAETNTRVNELAEGLRRQGIASGDRVAFYMGSTPEVIFLVLAVNKLGALWTPVNTDYKGVWLEETVNRSRPRMLVTDTAHAERIQAIRGNLEVDTVALLGDSDSLPDAIDLASLFVAGAAEPDMTGFCYGDTCAVLWTSGTTGRSKGVMQSHNVWFNAAYSADELFNSQPGDVIYNVLPLYNSGAWVTSIFRALVSGLTLAVDPSFSVRDFWNRVRYYGATQAFTIGAMHVFLWNVEETPQDADNPLRELMAVPMPPDLYEPFSQRFGVKLVGMGISQSEAMTIIRQDPNVHDSWPAGSCGNPVRNIDVALLDDEGNEVPVGEPGELCVKPLEPHIIFNGYFDDPEATRNSYFGEWYRTGDMLKRDQDDNYFFVDRKKDAVRYKGRNISTYEVELVLKKHPAIADCAAFGIPSEELEHEDEIKMDVVLKAGSSADALELARFINDNGPYFFVPRYIEFVDELPYTPNQKLQKFKLREKGITANTWDARAAGFSAKR